MSKPVYIAIVGSECEKKAGITMFLPCLLIRKPTSRDFTGFALASCAM